MRLKHRVIKLLWDAWCVASVVGIWPRFIEPNSIQTSRISIRIPPLAGLKICQISDLHIGEHSSKLFFDRAARKINQFKPDLIVMTGDFICYSKVAKKNLLASFLNKLEAPLGCFASLGNHDYEEYVTFYPKKGYFVGEMENLPFIVKGFKKLFQSEVKTLQKKSPHLNPNPELVSLLEKTPFKLLHNQREILNFQGHDFEVLGLGDLWAGQASTKLATKASLPRIVLSHNPDTIPALETKADLILSGHTHGLQVNLPWIGKRGSSQKEMQYLRGLKKLSRGYAYINRGLSAHDPFRWFSIPEITCFTVTI